MFERAVISGEALISGCEPSARGGGVVGMGEKEEIGGPFADLRLGSGDTEDI